jgi:DNA-binding protein H-NS
MATYKQLTAQLEKLHKEVAIAQQKEIAAVIDDIKRTIVDYDLTAEELGFAARRGQEDAAAAEVSRSEDRRHMERARAPTRLADRAQQGTLSDWCLNTSRVSVEKVHA